ncbi:MAG: DUF2079 domain-containing protein [Chloroflexi bacterium]|nr:DUF2079 domain-containing protein [Chloroflexota bacterium]
MASVQELAGILGLGLIAGLIGYVAFNRTQAALWVSINPAWLNRTLFVLVSVFALFYSVLQIRQFESFRFWGTDLAIFDQVIWNFLHGRPYQNTIIVELPIILGQHFSVLLAALAPVYALHADPRTLVIVPVLSVAVATMVLYWFGQRQLGAPLAFVLALGFVLSPATQYQALGQFYEVVLAIPLLMLAATFLLSRRYRAGLVVLAIAFLVKEIVPLVGIAIGLYLLIVHRRFKLGAFVALVSLLITLALILWIIPFFEGSSNYFFFAGSGYGSGQLSHLGTSLPEIVETIVTRPTVLFDQSPAAKLDALLKLIVPFGLLPFFGLDVLVLALPTLGVILLVNREADSLISYHHYATALPFFVLAAAVGARRILIWVRARTRSLQVVSAARAAIACMLLATSIGSYYLYAPGPFARNFNPDRYTPTAHDQLAGGIAAMIPAGATVIVQPDLAPLVAERERLYIMTGAPCLGAADYIFGDSRRPWFDYHRPAWDQALSVNYFEPIVANDGYVLSKRRPDQAPDRVLDIQFENGVRLSGYTLTVTGTLTGGAHLPLFTTWQWTRELSRRYATRIQVLDARDHVWVDAQREPCNGRLPPAYWETARVLYDDQAIPLPPTMPTGTYRLTLALFDKESGQLIRRVDSQEENVVVANLSVTKNRASIPANDLTIENRFYVDMQEIRLLGYVPPSQALRPGELFQIGLYWRARGQPKGDYAVAVQFRDAQGRVAFEHADRPASGNYPTTQWSLGEVLLDWHDVYLPALMEPGEYRVYAVLRDASTAQVLGEAALSSVEVLP